MPRVYVSCCMLSVIFRLGPAMLSGRYVVIETATDCIGMFLLASSDSFVAMISGQISIKGLWQFCIFFFQWHFAFFFSTRKLNIDACVRSKPRAILNETLTSVPRAMILVSRTHIYFFNCRLILTVCAHHRRRRSGTVQVCWPAHSKTWSVLSIYTITGSGNKLGDDW